MEKAKAGQMVSLKRGQVAIQPPCESKTGGQWFCITHDHAFNNSDWDDTPETHYKKAKKRDCLFAWQCFEHGLEQA